MKLITDLSSENYNIIFIIHTHYSIICIFHNIQLNFRKMLQQDSIRGSNVPLFHRHLSMVIIVTQFVKLAEKTEDELWFRISNNIQS